MDRFFSLEYGIGGLCVILTLSVFLKVGEFLWALREKKETLSESAIKDLTIAVQQNTAATQHLDRRLEKLEGVAAELPKFKTDIRRFYAAIKEVAGDKWPRIRDEILRDDFTQ